MRGLGTFESLPARLQNVEALGLRVAADSGQSCFVVLFASAVDVLAIVVIPAYRHFDGNSHGRVMLTTTLQKIHVSSLW